MAGNDISRTNVPDVRIAYRQETFNEEMKVIIDAVLHLDDLSV